MNATPNTALRPGWRYGYNEFEDPVWMREVDGLRYAVWIHPTLGVRTSVIYGGLQRALGGAPIRSQDVIEHMTFAEAWHDGLMHIPRPEQPAILMDAGMHRLAGAL